MGLVVSSVPIDLSQYAKDILEKCAPLLSSQNPATRLDAQTLLHSLAQQCSDTSAVLPALHRLSETLKSMSSYVLVFPPLESAGVGGAELLQALLKLLA